ncbi:MAG: insulinase family protein, partial [Rhodothermales bacterium]
MIVRYFSSVFLLAVLLAVIGAASPREAAARAAPQQDVARAELDDSLDAAFPVDPNVRIDSLENGLRYYVRRNVEPRERAELYLVVDAGSILEGENQLGLAHFVEHMLFNGTRNYPNEELIDFLESTGMRFGPDVNAYTSFDETVYTLTIPTDSTELVDRAFGVLVDWAAHATLSDTMIDRERGVVLEEWRMSDQNAQGRIRDALYPVLLHESRYATRLPIGTPEVIEHAAYETVRRFYADWYRPDLMAVVAVGDFDPDEMEARIRTRFAEVERPDSPAQRPTYEVPGHEQTLFEVITDPEYPYATVTAYYKQEADSVVTVGDYRRRLVGRLFNDMLNARLAEIARGADAPFLGASVFKGAFVRPSQFYGASAQVDEDSVLTGLRAVLTEVTRVRRHGFTSTELARVKQDVLRSYRRAYDEREKTSSGAFAREYVSHFLEGEPTPGIEIEYAAVQQLLPTIDVSDVNVLASDLLASENRVVVSILPEKEGVVPPTEGELQAVLDSVTDADVAPYVDDVQDQPLMASVPPPSDVVHRRTIPEIDVTELELANGVRVVMKPTDFKEDEIVMSAVSPGGSSLVPDSAAFSAETASQLVARSGVATFDRTALEKYLAGKVVSVSPYIGETTEGLRGSASPEDVETLLQLTYLYVTEPRASEDALSAYRNQMRSALVNRSANPTAVWQDSLQAALYGRDVRRMTPTIDMVDALAAERALEQYGQRFADASDFTFVFVGSFDVDSLTQMVRRYLGALPSSGREESWRDVAPEKPDGVVETEVYQGLGEQSYVAVVFHGPITYDRVHRPRIRS